MPPARRVKVPTRVQPEVRPKPGQVGQYTNQLHYMRNHLLRELPKHDFAMPFMEPVDAVALRVPTYYSVIKEPMDLGTITKRVDNAFYHCVDELVTDMMLIIGNCYTFNRRDAHVYKCGEKLEKYFFMVYEAMPKVPEIAYSDAERNKYSEKINSNNKLNLRQKTTKPLEQDAKNSVIKIECEQKLSEMLKATKQLEVDTKMLSVKVETQYNDIQKTSEQLEQGTRKSMLQLYQQNRIQNMLKEVKVEPKKPSLKVACGDKLNFIRNTTKQLEDDARLLFQSKWLALSNKLRKRNVRSVEQFDTCVLTIVKDYHDKGEHILNSFREEYRQLMARSSSESERLRELLNGPINALNELPECHRPKFKWVDSLIIALDDTLKGLKHDLTRGVIEEKRSYSAVLLRMFVDAQSINEGLCLHSNLAESSEDEEMEMRPRIVTEDERRSIQRQFDQLPPQSMCEIMHIIEQIEYGSNHATIRKRQYNVTFFSPETVALMKKAIDRAMRLQNRVNLRETMYTEKRNIQLNNNKIVENIPHGNFERKIHQPNNNNVSKQYAEKKVHCGNQDGVRNAFADKHIKQLGEKYIGKADKNYDEQYVKKGDKVCTKELGQKHGELSQQYADGYVKRSPQDDYEKCEEKSIEHSSKETNTMQFKTMESSTLSNTQAEVNMLWQSMKMRSLSSSESSKDSSEEYESDS